VCDEQVATHLIIPVYTLSSSIKNHSRIEQINEQNCRIKSPVVYIANDSNKKMSENSLCAHEWL